MKTLVKRHPVTNLLCFIPETQVPGLVLAANQVVSKAKGSVTTLCTVKDVSTGAIATLPAFAPALYEVNTGIVPTPDVMREQQLSLDPPRPIDPNVGDYALNTLIEFCNAVNAEVLQNQNIDSTLALFSE